MNQTEIKESIKNALKNKEDYSPEFKKLLEDKLKSLENGVINK